jgi:hypothetical protein
MNGFFHSLRGKEGDFRNLGVFARGTGVSDRIVPNGFIDLKYV